MKAVMPWKIGRGLCWGRKEDGPATLALKCMLQASREAQLSPMVKGMSVQNLFDEFAFLKLKGPRRWGHTTAIKLCVSELKLNAVVVCPNQGMVEFYRGQPTLAAINLASCPHQLRGRSPDAIFVECASMTDRGQLEELRHEASHVFMLLAQSQGRPFYYVEVE